MLFFLSRIPWDSLFLSRNPAITWLYFHVIPLLWVCQVSTSSVWMFVVLWVSESDWMCNTAILVNKNHGETSHTTSQHATLDRHDRSVWSKKIKREECDQADLGLLLETWSELQESSRYWLKFCQWRVRTHSRHVQKAQNKEEEEEERRRRRRRGGGGREDKDKDEEGGCSIFSEL